MINWLVRIKNKNWWISIIPAILLLVQSLARVFGYELHIDGISERLIDVINAAFTVLALVGVTVDPTTAGLGDSQLAMTYDKPKE